MKLILNETIESLGIIGSEVEVKKGYARNYLLPQGLAVLATPQNRKLFAQKKTQLNLQIAKERSLAQEMAQKLQGVTCTIAAKVSEADRLYGSITARDIVQALAAQDIQVERSMILLNEPLKTIGSFSVPVRIYKGIEPEITVEIVAE